MNGSPHISRGGKRENGARIGSDFELDQYIALG
jgi:hypothetical protein